MSDSIELTTGEYVPIEDTICECNHWYGEHDIGTACDAPGCQCAGFVADPALSTAAAIADRGGDPEKWPAHVKRARLEELRAELRAERISWGELVELQGLAEHIDPTDVELLEAAGVPEFPDD